MMTAEGWMTPLFAVVNGKNQNVTYWIHMIVFGSFMIVGAIFMVNLFIGVIIDNFNKIRSSQAVGGTFMTPKQRQWLEAR